MSLINIGAYNNISLDQAADDRNSWLLGRSMLQTFDKDRISNWIDNRGNLILVLNTDSTGRILSAKRFHDRLKEFDNNDSTMLIDWLKCNDIKFTYPIDNELLRYNDREHLIKVNSPSDSMQRDVTIFFPGNLAISNLKDKSAAVQDMLMSFNGSPQNMWNRESFAPTISDYNSAVLFTTLIYLYGENTVYDWLKERKEIKIEAFVKPDGQIIDVKCEHTADCELPKSLREDIINFWNLYDCRLRPSENQKGESVIELKFPCLSDDNNDIYDIFSRMRYIIVSSFTPDSQLL